MTITGRFKGVPLSILSVGMGSPNVDFFIREVRECLSGDMIVIRSADHIFIVKLLQIGGLLITTIRLGSCGCLVDLPVGSIVIPKASVAVSRNYDFDFISGSSQESPYRISKPVGVSNMDINLAIYLVVLRSLQMKSFIWRFVS